MKKYFLLFIAIPILFACSKQKVKLSIPTNKMVSILADIHVAENTANYLTSTKKDSMLAIYYKQIYDIHSTNEEEVKTNLELLKHEPDEMARMYKMVKDTIDSRLKAIGG